MPVNEIIDSEKIGKTAMFIILAPIVGMIISIIFTLIFIQRNTWLKVGILMASAALLFYVFIGFQENKLDENMKKFFKVDKYTYEINIKHDSTKLEKLEKAKANAEACKPYLTMYEADGAEKVADEIIKNVDLKDITISKTGDGLNKYFKIEILKNKSKKDTLLKHEYKNTLAIIDSLKPLAKKFYGRNIDSMIMAMNAVFPIGANNLGAFKKAVSVDIRKDLTKEIQKADNKILRWSLVGALMIFALTFIYTEKIKEPNARRTSNSFKRLQLLSSAAFSIGHGGNDAQKVMGIIAAALIANGNIVDIKSMPDWVPLSCYLAIGIGTLSGGWKIVKTMGTKITKVTPIEGVCAETAGATTLFLTEQMGIPVSTTHTITGSIVGVGLVKGVSSVKWGVTISLLWAWVLTIPVSAALAAIVYYLVHFFI